MAALFLGTDDNNDNAPVVLPDEARLLGSYLIGTPGTGKTTFLKSQIIQDIEVGNGVCVFDAHGDMIDDLLLCIPEERISDVILFDPADTEHPFGINLFECNRDDARERDRVTSTLMDTLYKLFAYSWGPRMEDLLRHSIQTLLYEPDSTFLELLLLLTDPPHRARLKKRACGADLILRHYWEQEFPESTFNDSTGLWKDPKDQQELVGSALNKIGRFLVNPLIRNIIVQPHSTINWREAMDTSQIILVNLSKGDLGPDNSAFLGSVMVNHILQAALSRRDISLDERRPFYLYVDEYQNFATKTFPELQSEARKYRIITTVAHQYRDQLDTSNQGSTLNVANQFVFRVSGHDAIELAGQFDNTPDAPLVRFEPLYTQVRDDGLYLQSRMSGSGETLYQALPGIRPPYSDAHLETANLLTTLPQHQAIIRILDTEGQSLKTLKQYRLNVQRHPSEARQLSKKEQTVRQERKENIRANAAARAQRRETIEADIKNRMGTIRLHEPTGGHTPESPFDFDEEPRTDE